MLVLKTPLSDRSVRSSVSDCKGCAARPYSVCAAVDEGDFTRMGLLADRLALDKDEPLVREGELARHVFNVTSGSFRVFKLLPDGRRQITGFLFAGDFLGLAAGEDYGVTAEALEPSAVCRFARNDYNALMRDCPSLESALLTRARRELAAAEERMLLLGRKTAMERLASFLLALPTLDPTRSGPADQLHLPMTRTEIADYLGLTIETVSRSLSRLKAQGVVRMTALNDLLVLRPGALRALADGD